MTKIAAISLKNIKIKYIRRGMSIRVFLSLLSREAPLSFLSLSLLSLLSLLVVRFPSPSLSSQPFVFSHPPSSPTVATLARRNKDSSLGHSFVCLFRSVNDCSLFVAINSRSLFVAINSRALFVAINNCSLILLVVRRHQRVTDFTQSSFVVCRDARG